jgi:predicted MFS family arabinose efflux permease
VPFMWHDADFRRFWFGQTASQFGEQACLVVIPLIAVLSLHASPGELGLLRAVQQAPILIFSLLIGAWVDHWRSRTVMVTADFLRAVIVAAVLIAYLMGFFGIAELFVVAFLIGLLSLFFDTSYQTAMVRLLHRDQLQQGNSILEGSRSAAQIGGPALGGVMVSLLAGPTALLIAGAFFILSVFSIQRMRTYEELPDRAARTGVWRQIGEGLTLVRHNGLLRTVAICSAAFQFSFAASMTVYLLFLPRTLHLSGAAVGLALAAMGPGALVGSLFSAMLPQRLGYGVVLVGAAAFGDGVLLCVASLHGGGALTVAVVVAVNFLFGMFGQLVDVTVIAVRQAVTPIRLQGRVVATGNFIGMGLTPIGSLLGGYLADEFGLRVGLFVAAAAMLSSPLIMAFSPLARLGRRLPALAG